jgi:hypothetical protein
MHMEHMEQKEQKTQTHRRACALFVFLVVLVGVLAGNPTTASTPAHASEIDPFLVPSRYFEETGHNVGGVFLSFFEEQGGVPILGMPITEVLEERGKRVQYFERARLEVDPAYPDRVHTTELGALLTEERTNELPFARHDRGPPAASTFFPATGHNLSHAFRAFWEEHGGYPIFGFPISEAFTEYPEGSEHPYTVQYFERARLDYRLEHPGSESSVQVGKLGHIYAKTQGVPPTAMLPARPVELLGSSVLYFQSSPAYVRNIRLAARQFEQLKIMPGEEVSFLAMVGELSAQTGYVEGGGIVNGRFGQVIAGGICYLSTAIYRAAFEAGMEIIERHPHSLALPDFTTPPGMDSAVFTPDGRGYETAYDVDLRWRNDMPEPVLLVTEMITSGNLTVSIWGYNDGRVVEIPDPTIHRIVARTPSWHANNQLGQCEVRQVGWGAPGVQITVNRTVRSAAGETLHEDSISSSYAPVRSVFHYGPGVVVPASGIENPAHAAREACLSRLPAVPGESSSIQAGGDP